VALGERFDLALSLEVAEHLNPKRADSFVADLCKASDLVLFSAALPAQDGDEHQNCQWTSYWAQLFVRQGYFPFDVVRPLIRSNRAVEWWYRTNVVLYVKATEAERIMANLQTKHLANLDLPGEMEIVGLKRATEQFLDSSRLLAWWTMFRAQQRLGMRSRHARPLVSGSRTTAMRGVFRLNGRSGGIGATSGWECFLSLELRLLRAKSCDECLESRLDFRETPS